jgi:hypothetical protein
MKNLGATVVVALIVGVGVGCGSDADNLTLDGADDLAACDIHAAREKFADAHATDSDHPQAALGYALTSLALLPEEPQVTALLLRIGFTSGMDMQKLVFGPDGALARHARGDTCDSIDTFVDATIPYPPLATPTIDGWTLVDPTLTATDFAAAADALSPQLAKIAQALETAAAGMTEPVVVEGGCGVGTVAFQAPELYAMAGIIELFRSGVQLGQAYDWAIGIKAAGEMWDGDPAPIVALLNQHIGRVIAASEAPEARAIAIRAFGLFVRAIDAAKVATVTPDGLFDWTAMPASLLDNGRGFAVAAQAMLEGPTALPGFAPTMSIDVSSVFTSPIDLQSFSTPLFVVIDEFTWDTDGDVIEQALTPLFAPNPFATSFTYTWTFEEQMNAFDSTPVTMPFDRYDTVFTCMTTPPP